MKTTSFILLVLLFCGCSAYNEVLKGDDFKAKFAMANQCYEKDDFDRSIVLYEQVFQNSPKSVEGELSYFKLAKSYYENNDYYMAGYFFGSFAERYPYSLRTEESYFMSAMCNVQNSPKWSLDQAETYLALNSVQAFIDKYPNSPLVDSCNQIIDELSYKIEFKDFNKVMLYDKTENYKAALSYAEIFTEKYPLSKHMEQNRFIAVKNSFYLALNSIESKKRERIEETIQRYRNFVFDFPKSESTKELDALLKVWENDYEF
jgi:outer membrane protein assembly factor BamD